MHRLVACATVLATGCALVPGASPRGTAGREQEQPDAGSNVGLGVFAQQNNHVIRPAITPRVPRPIQAGDLEATWVEDPANTWGFNPGDYRTDFGSVTSMLALSWGVTSGTALTLEAADFSRMGGFFDGFTDGFHGMFGFSDGDRSDYPKRDNVIEIVERDDFHPIEDRHTGSVWQTLGILVEHEIGKGDESLPALAVGCELRYLDSSQGVLDEEHSLSAGAWASAAKRVSEDFYCYLALGYGWHDADRWHDYALETTQPTLLAALEWRTSSRTAWILQYLFADGVTQDRPPWHEPSNEILVGWKGALSSRTQLELALIENTQVYGTAPDFGVHIGLRQKF